MSIVKRAAGLAVLGAAGAVGAYFFLGEGARRRRIAMRDWAVTFKGELFDALQDIRDINREAYHQAVDSIAQRYRTMSRVNRGELEHLVRDLKDSWGYMTKELAELRRHRRAGV